MMKVGFEVLHANPNMIHPHMHETWDYTIITNDLLLPPPIQTNPYPKSLTENHSLNLGQNNEVCDWVEHITKHFVEDHLPLNTSDNNIHNLHIQTNNNLDNNNNDYECDQGLNLITLLMECAVAISVENLGEAHRMLLELTQLASPFKTSCAERVVAYFAKAMISRVMNSWLGVCSPLIDHRTIHSALQVFNNISPFIKFSHFTSNQAILEAVNRCNDIHIIDLDIMQGLQWPAFFHILATRMEGRPNVRMTGMGASMELLVETGKNLSNFARRLGLCLEFYPIACKFGEVVDVSMLQIRPNETLAVHWLQHSLYDSTGPDWKTLRLLEELEPRIITLVEQDVNIGGSFLDRPLDVHVGQSVSVLVTLNQPPKDYYIVASTRFTQTVLNTISVLHYSNSRSSASGILPSAPPATDYDWSMKQARTYRWNLTANAARPNPQGSFHYGTIIPTKRINLANSAPLINGKLRYAVNSVSYINPDTPLKLADYFNIPGVFSDNSIQNTPSNAPAHLATSVLHTSLHDFIEVVFQNNENSVQSWHLDGYDFWVVGYGFGKWTDASRSSYNLVDALTRHTAQVYPNSWTAILVSLDNQGMWNLRSAIWERQYLGQQLYLRVWNAQRTAANEYDVPNNALLCGKALGHHA